MTATLERDDSLRRTGSAVVTLAASELLGKVATFLTFLVLARVLGMQEFGVLSFGLSLGLLLGVVSSLGLDARLVQVCSARPELIDRCYGALLAIRAVLSVAVLVPTTVVLYATMSVPHATAVCLLVASALLETFIDASRAVCGARQQQQLAALVLVAQRFAALGLSAGALVLTRSAWCAALGYLVATVVVGVVGMHVAARRVGARPRFRGIRPEVRLILVAAPVMGLDEIASMGLFRIDAALIGVLLGTTAVGVYGASYRIFETVLFVSWTLSRAYVPVIAARAHDTEHVRTWARRSLTIICAIYLPYGVVLALRGDDLVGLLFGTEYVHAGLFLALAPAPLLFGINHLCGSVLLARRPYPVVLVASVVGLALNVGLNLWLIPVWGITAAAAASSLAFLVEAVIVLVPLTRLVGSIASVPALVAIAVATTCAGLFAAEVSSLGLALAGGGVVYLAAWALLSRALDPDGFAAFWALLRSPARASEEAVEPQPRGSSKIGA